MKQFENRNLRVPSLLLAAALQVLPFARAALPVTQNAANIIVILFRWAIGSAAALGGVQAVSGASTAISTPLTSGGTNGQPYSLRLLTAPDPAHYWLADNVPPGLILTGTSGSTLWMIEGTPIVSGVFNIELTAKDEIGSGANLTAYATLTLTIVGGTNGPPSIIMQPPNRTVFKGANTSFSVIAGGTGPLIYQWHRGGLALEGRTNSTLLLSNVTEGQAGNYDVIITNNLGSVTSAVAVLTVNVPPVFRAGAYNGLYFDSNDLQHASSGFFSALLKTNGAFSARLAIGRRKLPFNGRFDVHGLATNFISRPGGSALLVELGIDPGGGNTITGRITDGVWSSPLRAYRAVFSSRTNPATAFAGKYTLIIPGTDDGVNAPLGDGYASLNVDAAGVASLSGAVSDGGRLLQKVGLSEAGELPFYNSLYSGKGSVFGWLRVHPTVDVNLDGLVRWLRPAGPLPRNYTNGFTLLTAIQGSGYASPVGSNVLGASSAFVVLTGVNPPLLSSNAVALSTNGVITSTGTNKVVLGVTGASGLFKGSVKLPGITRPVAMQGAVLREAGFGSGYFILSNHIGHVYFGP